MHNPGCNVCLQKYCHGPKFSDRQAFANSAHPDQTAPRRFVILSAPFGQISLWKDVFVPILA